MDILSVSAVQGFIRLCGDGWDQGWHERNGGNLTYRLTDEEAEACRPAFRTDRPWTPMHVEDPGLAGAFFLVTGSGRYMRNVALDPAYNNVSSYSKEELNAIISSLGLNNAQIR